MKHFLSGAENFSCPSSRLSYQYLLSNLQEISLNMGISVETDWGWDRRWTAPLVSNFPQTTSKISGKSLSKLLRAENLINGLEMKFVFHFQYSIFLYTNDRLGLMINVLSFWKLHVMTAGKVISKFQALKSL